MNDISGVKMKSIIKFKWTCVNSLYAFSLPCRQYWSVIGLSWTDLEVLILPATKSLKVHNVSKQKRKEIEATRQQ